MFSKQTCFKHIGYYLLSNIRATDGVVSVLGNHDYLGYHHWPTASDSIKAMERLRAAQRGMGWHLLENETYVLRRGSDSILVCGLENDGPPRFPSRADRTLTRTAAMQPFAIFLEHDPSYFSREIVLNILDIIFFQTPSNGKGQRTIAENTLTSEESSKGFDKLV